MNTNTIAVEQARKAQAEQTQQIHAMLFAFVLLVTVAILMARFFLVKPTPRRKK